MILGVTLMLAVNLAAESKLNLIGAVFTGYMLSMFYVISTAARLSSISTIEPAKAKRTMLVGLALRLLMLFAAFNVAIHISTEVFFIMAISFLVFYLIMLAGLVVHSYKSRFNDD